MPGEHEQLRLMAKVARLYHERGQRQTQIAAELHVSQARVSRLLKAAAAMGLVRTIVSMPGGVHTEVEEALEQRFGLSEAVVAEAEDEAAVIPALGAALATYVENTFFSQEVVGISSWSASLLAMVDALTSLHAGAAKTVVQLVGGHGQSAVQFQANRLLTRLAALTGAKPVFLSAPGVLLSGADVASLLKAPSLAEATTAWHELTVALLGIGSVEPSPLARESGNILPEATLEVLRGQGAVGDICFRYFDAAGALVSSELNETVVGISPDDLKRVPRRVGVAGGARKVAAIRAALRGGWVNVLVTDLATAEALLAV
ncbi:MAG: MarR family transcriptional regulator [Actinomycetia bacterium]|nr:MarR family transcriptional regulator [Actinomycetes bacterium]